jgi:hypothetical protein
VRASDDEGVTLLVEDAERTLAYGEIARAKMQVEFNRAADGEDGADDEDEAGTEDAGDDDSDDES